MVWRRRRSRLQPARSYLKEYKPLFYQAEVVGCPPTQLKKGAHWTTKTRQYPPRVNLFQEGHESQSAVPPLQFCVAERSNPRSHFSSCQILNRSIFFWSSWLKIMLLFLWCQRTPFVRKDMNYLPR